MRKGVSRNGRFSTNAKGRALAARHRGEGKRRELKRPIRLYIPVCVEGHSYDIFGPAAERMKRKKEKGKGGKRKGEET